MNQITNPPNDYPAGLGFDYAVWTADTQLTLCNVRWDNTYRDIVMFGATNATPAQRRQALDAHIDSLPTTFGNVRSRQAVLNQPVRVEMAINRVLPFNYIRAKNPIQPVKGGDVARNYYYFITDVRYLAPNTTELIVQLDVWQTFGYDAGFGNAFIERGHIGIANEKQFDSFGRDYLTVPEGLDVGGEYKGVVRRRDVLMSGGPQNPDQSLRDPLDEPSILVLSSIALFSDPGTITDPKIRLARGGKIGASSWGIGAYIFKDSDEFAKMMIALSFTPWIAQGIQSVTLIPNPQKIHGESFTWGNVVPSLQPNNVAVTWTDGVGVQSGFGSGSGGGFGTSTPLTIKKSLYNNWRSATGFVANQIPARYRHLRKLFTFPYMLIEATTWSGNALIIKPESWNDANATILRRANLVPPTQRVTWIIRGYNARDIDEDDYNRDDGGDFLDMAINIDSFPTIPVTTDQGIMYLAQNAHGIAFEQQSANWAQSRAMQGARVSYDQASMGVQTAGAQTEWGAQRATAMTAAQAQYGVSRAIGDAGVSTLTGGALGAFSAPPGGAGVGLAAGAATGALSGGIGIGQAAREGQHAANMTAMQNSTNAGSNAISAAQGRYNRDTNYDLANFAAQGDYANTLAGIQARVQDAQLTQPSLKGQFGGDLINVNYSTSELSLRWKMIDPSAMATVCEYWLQFGYAVNRYARIPASLMVMSKFTYWKLSNTYIISGGMPEMMKQAIRGIFEKGVTVWSSPADIGAIDIANNTPLTGITLEMA